MKSLDRTDVMAMVRQRRIRPGDALRALRPDTDTEPEPPDPAKAMAEEFAKLRRTMDAGNRSPDDQARQIVALARPMFDGLERVAVSLAKMQTELSATLARVTATPPPAVRRPGEWTYVVERDGNGQITGLKATPKE
jgi:hypothetical protein